MMGQISMLPQGLESFTTNNKQK